MFEVKQISQRTVVTFNETNFQFSEETTDSQPKIIPNHHDALHSSSVTLPEGLHQFGVLFFLLRVQPLLELIEDDQHLLADRNALASPQCRQRVFQTQVVFEACTTFP